MKTVRSIFVSAAACGLVLCVTTLAQDNTGNSSGENPTTKPQAATSQSATTKDSKTERMTVYYIDLYGKLTKSQDWIARAIGIISMARIDDPRASQAILDLARKDGHPLVRIYAWEALHARQDTLDKDMRAQWMRIGMELGSKGYLRGDLRLGFLGLLATEGPTTKNKKLFSAFFASTNSLNPDDIRTIEAMGDLLKQWQSQDLIQALISSMSKLDDAYRAELILRKVNPDIPAAATLWEKGSQVMWETTQQKWVNWAKTRAFKEMEKGAGPAYKGLSQIMPRGEKIDPKEQKWFKELEMKNFRLDQLDVGFCVDSTGSMGQIVRWIQHDVVKMLKAFELLSREPRIGITFYRDKGDEYLVKNVPLSSDEKALTKAVRDICAKGGGDVPEAVLEGLTSLLNQKWSNSKRARKVIMLIGDAPPHKETLDQINKLVTDYAGKGFIFYATKVRTAYAASLSLPNYDPELKSFDDIATKGGGQSVWVSFAEAESTAVTFGTAKARTKESPSPEQIMFRQVLTAAMEKDYHDRLDPFLTILMHYVDEPVKETRSPFAPVSRGPAPTGPPPKPFDPQKQ